MLYTEIIYPLKSIKKGTKCKDNSFVSGCTKFLVSIGTYHSYQRGDRTMQLCCTLHAAHTVGQAITDVTLRSKNKMRLPNCGRRNDTNRDGGIKKKARRPEAFRDVIIRRDRPLAGMVRLDKLALRVLFFF